MKGFIRIILATALLLGAPTVNGATVTNAKERTFDFSNKSEYGAVLLSGNTHGSMELTPGRLVLEAGPGEVWVAYLKEPISGNFYVETEFMQDDATGLVLLKNNNGRPDTDNFTMISVNTRGGTVYVNHYDRQQGKDNVRDIISPSSISKSRYESKLDGSIYSVPYSCTDKRLRIQHEALSNTFHFYYGTRLDKWGITSRDWMELAPLYAWLPSETSYFVGVVCRNETENAMKQAEYTRLSVCQLPETDMDDSDSGFRVADRQYIWSGFEGNATVVTFGEEFVFDKNIKFVFWDRNNNAPMWRLSNQFELSFEFSESGDKVFQGCHEAMSDRQRHGQYIRILEDNAVRKRILWHGIAMNPDYHHSGEEKGGTQKPTYDEYWTFYPDGTAARQFIDKPKMDIDGRRRSWGPEFIELMPIGGSLVEAGDICDEPALTLLDMHEKVNDFHPPLSSTFNPDTWNWDQIIFTAHFKENLPDFYIVYNQSDEYLDTWSGIKLDGQLSWQNPTYKFSHWPVGREPYGQNVSKGLVSSQSHGSYANEVTHTSIVSAGFYQKGTEYENQYLIDPVDGRKYRSHVMLVGISSPGNYESIRNSVYTWLDGGEIQMNTDECTFIGNNRAERCLEFLDSGSAGRCSFNLTAESHHVVNPVVKIKKWAGIPDVCVTVNGQQVKSISAIQGEDLLVWISATIEGIADIMIGSSWNQSRP